MLTCKKNWITRQCRAATFCLLECWEGLRKIEGIIQNDQGESCDALGTFFELESLFTSRYLYAPDLTLFFDGLHELEGMDRELQQSLSKKDRQEILGQLRKANWTYEQVKRIAKTIARVIDRDPELLLRQIHELAIMADDGGCQLSMEEIDIFILGIPEQQATQDV